MTRAGQTMGDVERWRMPSGRIAVIDLAQTPEQIEQARSLLIDYGNAMRIEEEGAAEKEPCELEPRRADTEPLEKDQMSTTVQAPPIPGYKSIRDDGFVKVKQKPSKKCRVIGPDSAPERDPEQHQARFAKRELAEMPLVIRRTSQGVKSRVWVDRDGRWWRIGGSIRVQRWGGEGVTPQLTHPRCIVITLYQGANLKDLQFLQAWVDRARTGRRLHAAWDRITAEWADEATFRFGASRPYVDPFHNRDKSQIVFPCEEPACGASWHTQRERHEADLIRHSGQVEYTIRVCKEQFPDPGEGWYVDLSDVDFFGTTSDVASIISDLEWAREECRRANQEV